MGTTETQTATFQGHDGTWNTVTQTGNKVTNGKTTWEFNTTADAAAAFTSVCETWKAQQ